MKILLIVLLLAGCDDGWGLRMATPEEQGDMARRCEAQGFSWAIGDWGHIYCKKK